MKKPVIIIMVVFGCIAAAAVICAILGIFTQNGTQQAAANIIIAQTDAFAKEQAPTPVPAPAPLGIVKNDTLPFSMLAPTTAMSFEELVGDNNVYEDQIPPSPPPDTYKLVINEYFQFATVYKQDEDGKYTVPVRYIIVSSGSGKNPTPKGTFKMGGKYVRFGLFASYGVYGQYWRQITRSFFCHSLIYSSRNANSYTSSYSHLGTRASHGCVRMMVPDARWIYYNIAPGTVCEIIRGDKDDEEAAAIKAQLVFPKRPASRPRLKPGQIPVTEAWPGWQGNAHDQYLEYLKTLDAKIEAKD
ncbi:MAG: L,D-transpeptidase [Christensenellales bacterium]